MTEQPVAIVTGAGKGIGRAVALGLARRGYRVVINARTRDDLVTLASEISQVGGRCETVTGDVGEPYLAEALAAAVGRFGRCDVLVNCAGVQPLVNEIENVPLKDWHTAIAVNLTGPFLTCRAIMPLMKARGRDASSTSLPGLPPMCSRGRRPTARPRQAWCN